MSTLPNTDYRQMVEQCSSFGAGYTSDELFNESIARIEALKLRIANHLHLPMDDRETLHRELDLLRGVLFTLGSLSQVADRSGPEVVLTGEAPPPRALRVEGIVGQSPAMQSLLRVIAQVAPTGMTVLLEGETGTGKELMARIIHINSGRDKFVAVNCGAFSAGVIESELFGHVRGAFTSASSDRKGKFHEADQGTIFLDEIGEMEPAAQVKLLRVLEQGELQRVGSDLTQRVNVRVVAATNRNLERMVREGRFREDLYYRLSICPLTIPPLRERRDEIAILLDYFFQEMANACQASPPRLTPALHRFITSDYPFPGNIRELKNLAQYLALLVRGGMADLADLPAKYRQSPEAPSSGGPLGLEQVRDHGERAYLGALLSKHRGNVQAVSREGGLSRSRLYQLLKEHQLRPSDYR